MRPFALVSAAVLLSSACKSELKREELKEHVEALGSFAAEARVMVELQAQGKSPAPFFIAHTEALSDRVSEALKELTRRDAEAEVKNQQREAVRGALRLSDVLRPLPQRMNPEAREHLRQLEQFFGGLKKSL